MKQKKETGRKMRRCLSGLLLMLVLLSGCGMGKEQDAEVVPPAKEEKILVGLILTSTDAPENEALIADFETMTEEIDGELMVLIPDVTSAEAEEARKMTGDFILYDADPIEYQMLHVNELVEANADVIAICANHPQRLESVLTAARGVGISVCAIEQEIGEESYDVYAGLEEAAEAVRSILDF